MSHNINTSSGLRDTRAVSSLCGRTKFGYSRRTEPLPVPAGGSRRHPSLNTRRGFPAGRGPSDAAPDRPAAHAVTPGAPAVSVRALLLANDVSRELSDVGLGGLIDASLREEPPGLPLCARIPDDAGTGQRLGRREGRLADCPRNCRSGPGSGTVCASPLHLSLVSGS
jgi:hypothetical protein